MADEAPRNSRLRGVTFIPQPRTRTALLTKIRLQRRKLRAKVPTRICRGRGCASLNIRGQASGGQVFPRNSGMDRPPSPFLPLAWVHRAHTAPVPRKPRCTGVAAPSLHIARCDAQKNEAPYRRCDVLALLFLQSGEIVRLTRKSGLQCVVGMFIARLACGAQDSPPPWTDQCMGSNGARGTKT